MIRIEVNIDDHQLLGSLSRLKALGRDASPVMRGLANILRASAQDAFDRERDPVTGARWPPLNEAYKKQRYADRYTGKTLNRTGDMRRSLSVRCGKDFALAGVNAAYAAAHQFGARTRAHVIRPRGKKARNVPGIGPLARVNHPGSVIPARPLNTLVLTGIAVPPDTARLSRTEQEVALKNGVTPLEVGPGEEVRIVRAISTYTRNAAGVADISLLDMTAIRTMDYVAKTVRERVELRFPREKLSARTPAKVRSEVLDVLRRLEQLEIVEEVAANAAGALCERDLQNPNRLNVRIPTDVVNGLLVFAGVIDLLL